jgi:hypothetical protein
MILLFVLPCVAGMTGRQHCTQALVEMASCELFGWGGLSFLLISTSQIAGFTGVSLYAQPVLLKPMGKLGVDLLGPTPVLFDKNVQQQKK